MFSVKAHFQLMRKEVVDKTTLMMLTHVVFPGGESGEWRIVGWFFLMQPWKFQMGNCTKENALFSFQEQLHFLKKVTYHATPCENRQAVSKPTFVCCAVFKCAWFTNESSYWFSFIFISFLLQQLKLEANCWTRVGKWKELGKVPALPW